MKFLFVFLIVIVGLGCVSEKRAARRATENSISIKQNAHLIRTAYTDEQNWKRFCELVQEPHPEYRFVAYIELKNNPRFKNKRPNDLIKELQTNIEYNFDFFFVVDEKTLSSSNYPVLCVKIPSEENQKVVYFRANVADLWIVENNLSIANMYFEDFLKDIDSNGVYLSD